MVKQSGTWRKRFNKCCESFLVAYKEALARNLR